MDMKSIRVCSKCGEHKVLSKYIAAGSVINSSSDRKYDTEFLTSSEYDFYYRIDAKIEHLHNTCRNCGYTWRESVANK